MDISNKARIGQIGAARTAQNANESQKHLTTLQARSRQQAQLLVPTGVVFPYAGSVFASVPDGSGGNVIIKSPPAGYLICDGSIVSYEEYRRLFDVIGYTYATTTMTGTNFQLPDLRGRVIVGPDDGANRISSNNTLAQPGGNQTHTLSTSQIPSHTHAVYAVQVSNTTTTGSGNRLTFLADGPGSGIDDGISGSTGGGSAHNNLQPYLVINYIIKT